MLRFIEELLDQDAFGSAATQSICFSAGKETHRDFFLNTPRLEADDRLIIDAPFTSCCFDLISAARVKPVEFRALAHSLAIPPADHPRLREYFTVHPPVRNQPEYHGDGVRVRYFGHACVLVQTDEVSILIDPVVAWEPDAQSNRLTFSDLPDSIDYVFLTHNHQDHFAPEVFLQLRGRIGRVLVPRNNPHNVADPNMRITLRNLGFTAVDVLDPMQTVAIAGGALTSLPFFGEHAALSISSKHGMYLQLKGRRLMFLADADCVDRMLYRRIVASLGKADVLFIGMECDGAPLTWLYGPYLAGPVSKKNDESRRLSGSDSDRAWAVAEEVGCSSAYVYAMGQEPWLKHLLGLQYAPDSKQIVESDRFVARCHAAGIPAERLNGCREMLF
jgi:L-ascorbate metabolism protein UlaG (beta-lactamase superfamily)